MQFNVFSNFTMCFQISQCVFKFHNVFSNFTMCFLFFLAILWIWNAAKRSI